MIIEFVDLPQKMMVSMSFPGRYVGQFYGGWSFRLAKQGFPAMVSPRTIEPCSTDGGYLLVMTNIAMGKHYI